MFIMNQINLLTLVVIATNHLSGAIIYCFPELICFVKNYIICFDIFEELSFDSFSLISLISP